MRHPFSLIVLLAAACATTLLGGVDNGLLALLPSNAKIVGGADVTRARGSEFGQYLLKKMQADDAHFQQMIDETGFDPRRDVQSILFASTPSADGHAATYAILARGNFDVAKIKTLAKTHGAVIQKVGDVDVITHNGDSERPGGLAFPDVGVAVMADMSSLKQIIANRATPSSLDPSLASQINTVGGANDLWYVSLVGGGMIADHMGDQMQQAKALQGVVQSSGGAKLGATIQTTFDATARSDKDATSLADVIRFMASMVQMQRQNDARAAIMASALDGMNLATNGSSVHFAVAFTEKSLEQLADLGPGKH